MKLTKDEAKILLLALEKSEYDFIADIEKIKAQKILTELEKLKNYMQINSIDKRRLGRKSHNSFNDILTRYVFKK